MKGTYVYEQVTYPARSIIYHRWLHPSLAAPIAHDPTAQSEAGHTCLSKDAGDFLHATMAVDQ